MQLTSRRNGIGYCEAFQYSMQLHLATVTGRRSDGSCDTQLLLAKLEKAVYDTRQRRGTRVAVAVTEFLR